MGLPEIVQVNITRGTKAVTQTGFGSALILGSVGASFGTDKVRKYTSLKGLAADFATSDNVYKAAVALMSQQKKPTEFYVGRRSVSMVAQVNTLTPDVSVQAINHYILAVDGVLYDFTGDATPTAAEVVTGLSALINADTNANVVASGTNTLILTAKVAGIGFSVDSLTRLANVATTANVGPVEDLIALQDAPNGDLWSMVILTSRVKLEILAVAKYIETQGAKMFAACSSDSDVITNATTDIASILKARGYSNTFYFWSSDQANYPEAAWVGDRLPFQPGSENWKFSSPAGAAPDDALTDAQWAYIESKNGNYLSTIAGVAIMQQGKVASGEWIDTIRFIQWLVAYMRSDVYGLFVSAGSGQGKIPYTDGGAAQVESVVRARLAAGIRVGGLAANPAPVVTVPKVADVPAQTRQARTLPDVNFVATLAGAINQTVINGVVSV